MSASVVLKTMILTLTFVSLLDRYQASRKPDGRKLDGRWLIAAAVTLVVGIICRQTDVAGRFSGPDAWYQGHAFWHLFTAASLASVYGFYRSEKAASARGTARCARDIVVVGEAQASRSLVLSPPIPLDDPADTVQRSRLPAGRSESVHLEQ